MQRHLLRIAVVTVLAFAAQAAYSPAAQALQQMRAFKCCTETCEHPQSFTAASRCGCCQVATAPGNLSAATGGKTQLPLPGVVAVANVESTLLPGSTPPVLATSAASPRAAPVFLLTLSIRL